MLYIVTCGAQLQGMNHGRTVFAQVMDGIHREELRRCVRRYDGERRVRRFSCRDQFLAMAFAQLTYRESLRDIEACLNSRSDLLDRLGFRAGAVARSTLAEANEKRDWRIYADLAQKLIKRARPLYADEELGLDLDSMVYAFDSTTIDLCLSLFPWARFRKRKGAIKLHTLLDLRGSIPTVVELTDGRLQDVNMLDSLALEPGAFYLLDRAYLDYSRLYQMHQARAFFVIRAKKNLRFARSLSRPRDGQSGVRSDQLGRFSEPRARRDYPERFRRVRYFDDPTQKALVFLTNNTDLPALNIADLYRLRWRVELFFKWIKQHLRIKSFFGTSENAVRTQIWIAVCVYVRIAILKKELRLPQSLHRILQVVSVGAFEKVPIFQLFTRNTLQESEYVSFKPLKLWDL